MLKGLHYTLMWQTRQKSRKNQCSIESSKWNPMKLNEFEIFSIEFWKYTWFILVFRGCVWAPMQVLWKMFKAREIRISTLSSRARNGHENDLDPISLDHLLGIQASWIQKINFMHFRLILTNLRADYDQIIQIKKYKKT